MKYEYRKRPDGMLHDAEVSKLLGISPRTLRAYLYERKVPEPDATFHHSHWWKKEKIEEFAKTRKRVEQKRNNPPLFRNARKFGENDYLCKLASQG